MTRFNMFTDEELNYMESVFCNEGLVQVCSTPLIVKV